MSGRITIAELAEETGASEERIVEFLKELGVRDLNGWEPSWTLRDWEAENFREHWEDPGV